MRVLIAMAGAGGLAAAALALVRRPSQGPLLYVLLFLQFAAAAFYDPARKALLPLTVRGEDLHLATTIDSFAWSLTGALGATAGGVLASRLGNTACFLVDAATYAAAAACALQSPKPWGTLGRRPGSCTRHAAAWGRGAVEREGARWSWQLAARRRRWWCLRRPQALLGGMPGCRPAAAVGCSTTSGGSQGRARAASVAAAAALGPPL